MRTALSVAGSDSGGGAGIQADIKTMTMNGVYAMSVITALTAQNTTGVTRHFGSASRVFYEAQLDAVFADIFPDAVKIGMASSSGADPGDCGQTQDMYGARRVVVDPVMVSTSGARLARNNTEEALREMLFASGGS